MKIYLVRHARTRHNVEHLCQGWTDTELDEVGLRQAGAVAEHFVDKSLGLIFSSDHKRAIQTALPTSLLKTLEIRTTELLRERNLGELENMPVSALREAFEEEIRKTGESRFLVQPRGAESAYDVMARVNKFLDLVPRNQGDVAIFTHGMTEETLLCNLIGASVESSRSFEFDNASITTLEWNFDVWVMKGYNESGHLSLTANIESPN